MHKLTVRSDAPLFDYLFTALQGIKRTKLKDYLKRGAIAVNGKVVTAFNHALKAGDRVEIETDKQAMARQKQKSELSIIYEDRDILVIDKPSGLLTIASDREKSRTAYAQVCRYLTAGNTRPQERPLFIVHRLDQGASGLLVFAKTYEAKNFLQENWHTFSKKYYAVVEGTPKKTSGTLESWLCENDFLNVFSMPEPVREGKHAITHYKVLATEGGRSLLEVELETGRKHQIRVHMATMGNPILGDDRYGGKDNKKSAPRLALHAFSLKFEHPATGKQMEFETGIPEILKIILKDRARS